MEIRWRISWFLPEDLLISSQLIITGTIRQSEADRVCHEPIRGWRDNITSLTCTWMIQNLAALDSSPLYLLSSNERGVQSSDSDSFSFWVSIDIKSLSTDYGSDLASWWLLNCCENFACFIGARASISRARSLRSSSSSRLRLTVRKVASCWASISS